MPRLHPEEMVEDELIRLVIAGNPQEAEQIEAALDAAAMDFTFEITSYSGGILSGIKTGVMFMVRTSEHEQSVKAMEQAGLANILLD